MRKTIIPGIISMNHRLRNKKFGKLLGHNTGVQREFTTNELHRLFLLTSTVRQAERLQPPKEFL